MTSILFCVWLVPALPDKSLLQARIDQLASEYQAPSFQPHVTLFCGQTIDIAKTTARLGDITEALAPISLSVDALKTSAQYYKTLYLQFTPEAKSKKLVETIKQALDPNSPYQFNPHMSLLYKKMPLTEKGQIADQLQTASFMQTLKTHAVPFDQIQLRTDSEEENAQAVLSWRSFKDYRLGN